MAGVEDFLGQGGRSAEHSLRYLTTLLNSKHGYPPHVVEILQSLRSHAEEDYSNFLHLQSILPHAKQTPVKGAEGRPANLSLVEAVQEESVHSTQLQSQMDDGEIETGVAAGDDMFLIEGVEDSKSPQSLTFSDGEGEESEADEGIHLPRKRNQASAQQVAASLPVSIPWPDQLTQQQSYRAEVNGMNTDNNDDRPADIAASIQAMAKSVHTSSMFGDNVFGELPSRAKPPQRIVI